MRQPERADDADNPLRLCYTGPSPDRERQLEIEAPLRPRIVCGYAMSESPYGLIWARGTRPYGTLGSIRQHPTSVTSTRRAWSTTTAGSRRRDRRAAAAQPGRHARLLGDARRDRRGAPVDGWLRTGDLVARQRRRHLHLRRPEEGGHPPARREPRRRPRSRRLLDGIPTCRGRRGRRAVRALRGGREGVRRGRRARRAVDLAASVRVAARAAGARSRCRATSRSSTTFRTRPPAGSPSTGCRERTAPRSTSTRDGDELTTRLAAHRHRRLDRRHDHAARPRPRRRDDGPAHPHRARVPARAR